ncbi:hypothetical protein [Acrocarpospora sp. B8E8]|uniref:effector-associated constant component EACC1 n=1 Tax=Acrocarpospora sp. B8E8 TaxID=3153572 RepID=UPI00325CC0E6
MKIRISITALEPEEELRSLYNWLRDEPVVRQNSHISLDGRELKPDEMGDTLDLITLVVTSGLQLPALIETISGWRATRRNQPTVILYRGDLRIEFTDTNIDEVLKILDALEGDDQD